MNCKENEHMVRDNEFGVTWCIKCGRLYNKPCNRLISEKDRINAKLLNRFDKTWITLTKEEVEQGRSSAYKYLL